MGAWKRRVEEESGVLLPSAAGPKAVTETAAVATSALQTVKANCKAFIEAIDTIGLVLLILFVVTTEIVVVLPTIVFVVFLGVDDKGTRGFRHFHLGAHKESC